MLNVKGTDLQNPEKLMKNPTDILRDKNRISR